MRNKTLGLKMILRIALLTCLVVFLQPCYGQMAANLTDNEISMQKRQWVPVGVPVYPVGVIVQPQRGCNPSPVVETGFVELPNSLPIAYDCGIQTPLVPVVPGKRRRSEGMERMKRIINGGLAYNGQWPWAVSLVYKGQHSCTGSLISPQWVLTAAHCFPENPVYLCEHAVVLGESYIDAALAGRSLTGQVRGISKVIRNPSYSPLALEWDIALIKLSAPVAFTPTVSPVCLPNPTDVHDSTSCSIAGWGVDVPSAKGDANTSPVLKHLTIPVFGRATCEHLLQQNMLGRICLANQGPAGDACFGDSGGPLVCMGASGGGRWSLLGVTSHGTQFVQTPMGTKPACGTFPSVHTVIPHPMGGVAAARGNPTVYTDVRYYLNWIEGVVSRNGGR